MLHTRLQLTSLLLLGILIIALPLAVIVTQQKQIDKQQAASGSTHHYFYTFPEGSMNVYDMDNNFSLVKTVSLPTSGHGVRGVATNLSAHTVYVSYGGDGPSHGNGSMLALDLLTDSVLWTKNYSHGIDSMAITPDGSKIYMPDGETTNDGNWYSVDTSTGNETGGIINTNIGTGDNGPHNTAIGLNGQHIYMGDRNLASRGQNYFYEGDTTTNQVIKKIGPFQSGIRPFAVNKAETLAYVTVTGLLGFQIGDIPTGKVLYTVQLIKPQGVACNHLGVTDPSHGISLSPDETQLYVIDHTCNYVHVFDVSHLPASAPTQIAAIPVNPYNNNQSPCTYDCEGDGWLSHSLDGHFVFVGSSGDIIDTAAQKVTTHLNTLYNTRIFTEIDWQNGIPVATENRSAIGAMTQNGFMTPSPGFTQTPTSIKTTTPSPTQTLTSTPTPTSNASISFSLTLCPHGLGNCGDNASPSSGGNTNPLHTTRNVTLTVFDTTNNQVAQQQGQVTYVSSAENFQGVLAVPSLLSGQYLVTVKMEGYLGKQIPGIILTTQGQTVNLPLLSLVNGDINNDNQLDISDYNLLLSCFGSRFITSSCLAPATAQSPGADIDDDGTVGGADYNLFLRELSVQNGDSPILIPTPTLQPTGQITPAAKPTATPFPTATGILPPSTGLLPGGKLWKNNISSYIFGTNDTGEWGAPNIEFTDKSTAPGTVNTVSQNLVMQGGFTLDRMFIPHHDFANHNEMSDAEIQARLNTAVNMNTQCLGVLVSVSSTQIQPGDTMSDLDFAKHVLTLSDGNHQGYGKCSMFEIGNEFAAGPSSMTTYIQQWNLFVPALKAVRPDAIFIGPVIPFYSSQIMRQFLQGAHPLPDAVSWHQYACGGSHSYLNDAEQCSKVVGGYITSEAASVRQDIQSTVGHALPIGISEWSSDNRNNGSQNLALQEPGMSDFITAALNAMIQAHLDFANEFDMQSGAAYRGLDMLDSNNQPRAYFTAFTSIIGQYKQ